MFILCANNFILDVVILILLVVKYIDGTNLYRDSIVY